MAACQLNVRILKLEPSNSRRLFRVVTARIHGLKAVVLRLFNL
jgi:hypothetical protein